MKVFMAGATGVIGHRAVRLLVESGHEVTGVARTDQKAALLRKLGATPVAVNLFDGVAVKHVVAGHDAVVNLATNIPPLEKVMDPSAWQTNDRLRTEASANLARAAAGHGCEVFVQESITYPYSSNGEDWIDESVAIIRPPELNSNGVAEEQALSFGDRGARGIILRFSMFYSNDGSHARAVRAAIRSGNSPFMGNPSCYTSLIHTEDAAGAVVCSLKAPGGIYNVSDDEPMRRGELVSTIAGIEGVRPPAPPNTFEGEMPWIVEVMSRSHRISNKHLKDTAGWAPRYRSAAQGWKQLVSTEPALS